MPPCKGTRADGSPCRADARRGSEYCVFHDNATADAMAAGRAAGNEGNRRRALAKPNPAAEARLRPWRQLDAATLASAKAATPLEVAVLVADTIDQVRAGEISPTVANSVGYLAQTLAKLHEQIETDRKIDFILEVLQERRLRG